MQKLKEQLMQGHLSFILVLLTSFLAIPGVMQVLRATSDQEKAIRLILATQNLGEAMVVEQAVERGTGFLLKSYGAKDIKDLKAMTAARKEELEAEANRNREYQLQNLIRSIACLVFASLLGMLTIFSVHRMDRRLAIAEKQLADGHLPK